MVLVSCQPGANLPPKLSLVEGTGPSSVLPKSTSAEREGIGTEDTGISEDENTGATKRQKPIPLSSI